MRKFKLIQTYPESPPLGTVIIKTIITGSENTIETYCIWGKDKNCDGGKFRIPNPWLYKYNWEEIIEKDYEILSFRGRRFKEDIWKLLPNGDYNYGIINIDGNYKNWSKDMCLKALDIHSIKRLSDSEVFTVGDKTNNGTISKFEVDTSGVRVFFEEKPKNYHVSLNTIKHAKTALFRTEDGVDIFEGDIIFGVNMDWKVFSHYTDLQNKVKSWGIKPIFSTKEAAEEYINLKKPYLSNKDVLDEINKCTNIQQLIKVFTNKAAK